MTAAPDKPSVRRALASCSEEWREDELESDQLGVRFMADAGYDPNSMVSVMQILAEANQGQQPPEFFSTHPNPDRRIERIQAAIAEEFPEGVPEGLIK